MTAPLYCFCYIWYEFTKGHSLSYLQLIWSSYLKYTFIVTTMLQNWQSTANWQQTDSQTDANGDWHEKNRQAHYLSMYTCNSITSGNALDFETWNLMSALTMQIFFQCFNVLLSVILPDIVRNFFSCQIVSTFKYQG